MADDDTGSTGGKTFTQAEVDQLIKDRLARERGKYADYDDLKARAADADKSKTQLDKMQEQLDAMAKRAETSERAATIREVADELKISVKQASRLTGGTKEELLADGREFLADFAPKSGTQNDGKDDAGDDKGSDDGAAERRPGQDAAPRRGRPAENLRSGAPRTQSVPEETDPRKLAEAIPRY